MKRQKTKHPLFSAGLMMVGFFLVLGTIGALEVNNIGMSQAFVQGLAGIGVTYLGALGAYI